MGGHSWIGSLAALPRSRARAPLSDSQRRAVFAQARAFHGAIGWGYFLDHTTDHDGEAELLAAIERDGFLEAGAFAHWQPGNDIRDEWGPIGDPASLERADYAPLPSLDWRRKEAGLSPAQAVRRILRDMDRPEPAKPSALGRCSNCGEPAVAIVFNEPLCPDCKRDALAASEP